MNWIGLVFAISLHLPANGSFVLGACAPAALPDPHAPPDMHTACPCTDAMIRRQGSRSPSKNNARASYGANMKITDLIVHSRKYKPIRASPPRKRHDSPFKLARAIHDAGIIPSSSLFTGSMTTVSPLRDIHVHCMILPRSCYMVHIACHDEATEPCGVNDFASTLSLPAVCRHRGCCGRVHSMAGRQPFRACGN